MTSTAIQPVVSPAEVVTPSKTRVIFLIDSSSSMSGKRDAVIKGYNEFLRKLGKEVAPITYTVTTVHFATSLTTYCRDLLLKDVPKMTLGDYVPTGMTAMFDAIGQTITDTVLDDDERALVVIQTDGEENSSKHYNVSMIKEMIESAKATGRWAFLFLIADVTQWQAERYSMAWGADAGSTRAYDGASTNTVFSSISGTVHAYSTGEVQANDLGRTIEVDASNDEPD